VAATVSLALGLYQTLRPGSTNKLEWIEGVAILVAVIIVVVAQSVNDWQKERQFVKLNHKVNNYYISLTFRNKSEMSRSYETVLSI
jgi:P-type Ca2+ transporter type 2C